MMMGPEPMSRIFCRSVRFGMASKCARRRRNLFLCYILLG